MPDLAKKALVLNEFMLKKRRHFLRLPALLGLGVTTNVSAKDLFITPAESEGPFYPVVAQADQDFDLTQVAGRTASAQGEAVFMHGKVLDTDGSPISGATIDLWQANTHGKYRHPFDSSKQALDDNFQGWAIIQSGINGDFRFKTIIPGAYDVGRGWTRPPHLHFKVSRRGFVELTTQMYFPEQELNEQDLLLQQKTKEEQQAMIAKLDSRAPTGEKIYRYDIVLEKVK